ncbi:hypothetical protein FHU10_0828 [Serratia fonticola]|uniref:Fimbrial protein n=1 Tax=Serratia fonticola TaxID=47917 RepID=A0A542BKK3_SERFO|nr:hypothetical protein FHU09_1619 [Serratia fonticola]TVZ68396.1 hypothetical protein FHU10_0828 [Serratia fonticola]
MADLGITGECYSTGVSFEAVLENNRDLGMKYIIYSYGKLTKTLIFAASCIPLLPMGAHAIVEGGALNLTVAHCGQGDYQTPPGGFYRTCTTTGVVVPVILTDQEAAQTIPTVDGSGWRWGVVAQTSGSAGTVPFGGGNYSVEWLSDTVHTNYGSAVEELKSMVGRTVTVTKSNYVNSTETINQCAGLIKLFMSPMYPTYLSTVLTTTFPYPVNQCRLAVAPPTPPVFCAPVTQRIDFNFGTINRSEAAGKSLSKPITMQCSANNVAYKLTLPGDATNFRLSNGMNAAVSTSKGALGSTFYGGTSETFDINVTLNGQPTTAGSFYGSSILMVTYP